MNQNRDLRQKTFSGIIWKFFERICVQGVSLIISIILARLLMPEDYSVVSIISIFFSFCNVLISGGLNTSLIQKKDSDILDYSTILHVSMIVASILYIFMFFAASYIADIYDKEILVPLIRVMGITFFVNAFKGVICAKVSNNMEFRKFFFSTIVGTIISSIIGVIMALRGYGPWALVAQQMSNSMIDTVILFFVTKFRFVFVISFSRFKSLFKYGWKLFLASIVSKIYDEAKPLIIGVKFSSADLAFYNKGFSFPNVISSTISDTVSSVLFPALSKLQDDKNAILSASRRYIKISSFFIFPLMIGLFVVANTFINVILTEKWAESVPFMQLFCIYYMFDLIQVGNLQIFKAMGRTDISLITEIIKKSLYFVVILIFVVISNNPIVFAFANIVCMFIATIVNTYPNRKLLGYTYKNQCKDIIKNLLTAIIMGICVYFVGYVRINNILLLALQLVVGVIVYIGISVIIKNENLIYMIVFIKNLLRGREKKDV